MKRKIARFWLPFVVVCLMVGLGAAASAQKTELLVSRGGYPGIEHVEALFEELNPDIDLQILGQSGGLQLAEAGGEGFIVQLAGGIIPDVVMMADATIGGFAAGGALTDLTKLLETAENGIDGAWPAAWEAVRYEGRIWGVPYVTDTRALNYNKDLLSAAGIDAPPRTLEELDEYALRLTVPQGDGYDRFGFWPLSGNWWLWGWGWLFGGDFYDEAAQRITADHPGIVAALEYEMEYVNRYQWTEGGPPGGTAFCSGTLAMELSVSTSLRGIKDGCPEIALGVAPPPPPQGRETATWSGIWVWAMPKDAPHPEAAWRYLQFMASAEAQLIQSEQSGDIPTNLEAIGVTRERYTAEYGEPGDVYLSLTPYTNVRPITVVTNDYWNELQRARIEAHQGAKAPRDALIEITRILNERLQSELARLTRR